MAANVSKCTYMSARDNVHTHHMAHVRACEHMISELSIFKGYKVTHLPRHTLYMRHFNIFSMWGYFYFFLSIGHMEKYQVFDLHV